MGMTADDKAIEALAFQLYCQFARVPLPQCEYRWAKSVSPKVKEQFRAEAAEEIQEVSHA
jgi:hypothetical protein